MAEHGLSRFRTVTVIIILSPTGTLNVTLLCSVKQRHVIFKWSNRRIGVDASVCMAAARVLVGGRQQTSHCRKQVRQVPMAKSLYAVGDSLEINLRPCETV